MGASSFRLGFTALADSEHVFDTVTGSDRSINPLDTTVHRHRHQAKNSSTWDAPDLLDRGEMVRAGG
jgi:hypothetical protein